MNYLYKDNVISTKLEWEEAFNKAYNSEGKDIHWKIGRSGECLAEDFIGKDATGEESIVDMIASFLGTTNVVLETAKIEHRSIFDNHPTVYTAEEINEVFKSNPCTSSNPL